MPTRVELMEPGKAIEQGRGYVGVTDPSDASEIFFPHVDSCLALALILDNKRLIGGHVPQQWPGQRVTDMNYCVKKIIDLMDAELNRVKGNIERLIMAGDSAWFHADRGTEANTAMAKWEQYGNWIQLSIDPKGGGGADVYITRKSIKLVKCNKPFSEQTFADFGKIKEEAAIKVRF
jgi:hypothetical protein